MWCNENYLQNLACLKIKTREDETYFTLKTYKLIIVNPQPINRKILFTTDFI